MKLGIIEEEPSEESATEAESAEKDPLDELAEEF